MTPNPEDAELRESILLFVWGEGRAAEINVDKVMALINDDRQATRSKVLGEVLERGPKNMRRAGGYERKIHAETQNMLNQRWRDLLTAMQKETE